MDDIQKEMLRTFSAGKNARQLKTKEPLEPGTYQGALTVTIEGALTKKPPTVSNTNNTAGSAYIVRYLLDRLNEAEFNALRTNIAEIRKGKFTPKNEATYAERIDAIMPRTESVRSGATSFDGFCIVEDVDINPSNEALEQDGMRLIIGERK